jgi:hypothetical protein
MNLHKDRPPNKSGLMKAELALASSAGSSSSEYVHTGGKDLSKRQVSEGWMQLSAWLQGIGLEPYAPVFVENGIDVDSLPLPNESDLEKLGVLLGHRRKLLKGYASGSERRRMP